MVLVAHSTPGNGILRWRYDAALYTSLGSIANIVSNRDTMQTSNMSANLDMPLDAIIAQNQTGRKGGGKGRGRGKGGSGCVFNLLVGIRLQAFLFK